MFLGITVIIQIFEKRIPMEKGGTSGPPPKNMTNMTRHDQASVMPEHEDNPASQDPPDHLTKKKKAEHTMIIFLG